MISLMLCIHLNLKFMLFPQFCVPFSCLSPTILSPSSCLPYYSLTIILPPLFPSSPLSYWPLFSTLLYSTLTFSIPLKQHHEDLPALSTLLYCTLLYSHVLYSTVTTSRTSSSTQRTKDYEDVLKKALCDLSKSYPVETHELLYNFRLEVILLSSFFCF